MSLLKDKSSKKNFWDYLPGILAGTGTIAGTVVNAISAYKNRKAQESQLSYQKELDEKNYTAQQEQFEYQKYLNNNQFQIQSADAQKAGINPLAMNGGSLSSGSYSNVSSGAQAPQSEGVGELINSGALALAQLSQSSRQFNQSLKSQEDMHKADLADKKKERDTQVYLKLLDLKHDKNKSDTDRRESARQFDSQLTESARQFNEKLASENSAQDKSYRLQLEQFKADVMKYNNSLSNEEANLILTAKQAYDLINSVGFDSAYGQYAEDFIKALKLTKDTAKQVLGSAEGSDFDKWFKQHFKEYSRIVLPEDL